MQKVERKRQEECRSNADAFLARMAAGEADAVNLKRHTDKDLDDDSIKKVRIDEDVPEEDGDDDKNKIGVGSLQRNVIHSLATEGNCSHE
ncbi:unnamed protein product, partial [Anisakis simplex]|uniref:Dynein light chain n=1 Tax=Anisakis simplex TaxID=6269 RepID=A0A0M3JH10_ANISI